MSVSLATAGNTVSGIVTTQGLGSGLDISSLVTSLVSATIQPTQTLLQNSLSTDQSTISALGSVQSALSSLQTAAQSLTTAGGSLAQLAASSSNSAVFTASAGSGAVSGNYQVQIQTLATANTLQSAAYSNQNAVVGTGTYSFTAGGSSFSVTLGSSNDTLSGLASAINGAAGNNGVSATVVNGSGGSYLLLSATQTGTANAVSVSSSSSISFTSVQSAADATGTIDGLPFDSASNVISNVLSGVTLNLASASPNTTQSLSVSADTGAASTAVQSFIAAYNSAISLITTDTAYTAASGSSSSGTAGPLLGDVGVENALHKLQAIIGGKAGSAGDVFTQLSQIGVTVGSDGTLSLDSSKLQSALQQNSGAVQKLFGGSNGIATQLNSMLETVSATGGTLDAETTAMQANVTSINDRLTDLTARSQKLTAQYNAEFNAMDNIVAAYKSTQKLLTQLYDNNTNSSSSSSSSS